MFLLVLQKKKRTLKLQEPAFTVLSKQHKMDCRQYIEIFRMLLKVGLEQETTADDIDKDMCTEISCFKPSLLGNTKFQNASSLSTRNVFDVKLDFAAKATA